MSIENGKRTLARAVLQGDNRMVDIEETSFGWRLYRREGKETVSRATVYRLQIRIEEAVLPTAGLAGVFTEEGFRHRGYARQVVERALQLMVDEDFALSCLYGVPSLYQRWGYRTATGRHAVLVKTRDLELHLQQARVPSIISHRTANEEDYIALRSLYTQDNASRTGSLVRETTPWQWYRHGSVLGHPPIVKVVEKRDGTIDSYAVFDKAVTDDLIVAELGCGDWRRFPLLLRLIVAEATRRRNGCVRFLMPLDHPATHYLKYVGAETRSEYTPDGGGMYRIIDLRHTGQALRSVWQRRLRQSMRFGTANCFSIETDLGTVAFAWDGASLRMVTSNEPDRDVIVRCSQDWLVAAILGHIPGDQLSLFGADVMGDRDAILRTLFPAGDPFMWPTDWF